MYLPYFSMGMVIGNTQFIFSSLIVYKYLRILNPGSGIYKADIFVFLPVPSLAALMTFTGFSLQTPFPMEISQPGLPGVHNK